MKTPDVLGCFSLLFLFNYKDSLRGESGNFGGFKFFSFFCIYLLGGSASPPLASRWYLWPPCRFSPKQSIKQIDPVHIVQHMGKLIAWNYVLFSQVYLLFLFPSFFFILTIAKWYKSVACRKSFHIHRSRKEKKNRRKIRLVIYIYISRGNKKKRRGLLDYWAQIAYSECTRVLICARSLTSDNRESLIRTTRTCLNTFQNNSRRCIANLNHTKTVLSGMSNKKSYISRCVIVCQRSSRLLYCKDKEIQIRSLFAFVS